MSNENIKLALCRLSATEAAAAAIAAKKLGYRVKSIAALAHSGGDGLIEIIGDVPPHHWKWLAQAGQTGAKMFAPKSFAMIRDNADAARAALSALPAGGLNELDTGETDSPSPSWNRMLRKHGKEVCRLSRFLVTARLAGNADTRVTLAPNEPDLTPPAWTLPDDDQADTDAPGGDDPTDAAPVEPIGWQDRMQPFASLLSGLGQSVRKHLAVLNDDELDSMETDAMAANPRNCTPAIHQAAQWMRPHVAAEQARRGRLAKGVEDQIGPDDDDDAGMVSRV
jgi:hypothetical protein